MTTADDNWHHGFDLAMRFTETFPGIKISDNDPIYWLAMEIANLLAAARNGAPQGGEGMSVEVIKQAIVTELQRQHADSDAHLGYLVVDPEWLAVDGNVDHDALARAIAAALEEAPP